MRNILVPAVIALLFSSCYTSKECYRTIDTKDAPKAIGPYSQAFENNGFLFCSGQIGLSPATGALVGDDISSQTKQALDNLKAVLAADGLDMRYIVKATIYLKDLNDYAKVNEIYKEYFPDELKPARAVVQVARLPKDALIEIECIATSAKSHMNTIHILGLKFKLP